MPNRPKLHDKIISLPQSGNAEPSSQKFWINPTVGPPYEIDLTEFFLGGRRDDKRFRARVQWTEDFGGRPTLGQELGVYLRARRPVRPTTLRILIAFRAFYRFLNEVDPKQIVASSAKVTDAHGDQFLIWAGQRWSTTYSHTYRMVKSTLAALRRVQAVSELFWPARPQDSVPAHPDIDEEGVRRLFDAFRAEGRQVKSMFLDGDSLGGCPLVRRK